MGDFVPGLALAWAVVGLAWLAWWSRAGRSVWSAVAGWVGLGRLVLVGRCGVGGCGGLVWGGWAWLVAGCVCGFGCGAGVWLSATSLGTVFFFAFGFSSRFSSVRFWFRLGSLGSGQPGPL